LPAIPFAHSSRVLECAGPVMSAAIDGSLPAVDGCSVNYYLIIFCISNQVVIYIFLRIIISANCIVAYLAPDIVRGFFILGVVSVGLDFSSTIPLRIFDPTILCG
jgi:hypothetical protein